MIKHYYRVPVTLYNKKTEKRKQVDYYATTFTKWGAKRQIRKLVDSLFPEVYITYYINKPVTRVTPNES